MNYIRLENPKNIFPETSVKKNDYYLVGNFTYNNKTKAYYLNQEITPEQALDMIRYENIECRLYGNAKKSKNIFVENRDVFYTGVLTFLTFFSAAYIISAPNKNGK